MVYRAGAWPDRRPLPLEADAVTPGWRYDYTTIGPRRPDLVSYIVLVYNGSTGS